VTYDLQIMTQERKELILRILLPGFFALGLASAAVFLSHPGIRLGLPLGGAILGSTALLIILMARYSILLRHSRDRLDASFRESEQRYREFVDATSDGFLFVGEGEPLSADQTLSELTGFTCEEIRRLRPEDLILPERDGEELLDYLRRKDPDITGLYEVRLRRKEGGSAEAVISASPIHSRPFQGFVLIIKDMGEGKESRALRMNLARETVLEDLQTSLLFMNRPVRDAAVVPVPAPPGCSIRQAAELMSRRGVNSLILRDENGRPGILTDQDLRDRVLLAGLDSGRPAGEAATFPLISVPEDCLFSEAVQRMREAGVRQVGVENSLGELTGLLTEKRLMQIQADSPYPLLEELKRAQTPADLRDGYGRLPGSLQTLVEIGADAVYICRLVTRVSRIITVKIIQGVLEELGPPPVRFAFLALGSDGRGEQTLLTDQDNALLFQDPDPGDPRPVRDYFLKLGEMVCTRLDQTGYRFCKGGVMASRPEWCRSLSEWKEAYHRWLSPPEDQGAGRSLLEISIFYDFVPVYGDRLLARELRNFMNRERETGQSWDNFLYSMAETASRFSPPVNFRGRIQVSLTEEKDEVFDIKKALSPLVLFARIYALQHGLVETGTVERLRALTSLGVFSEERYLELEHAFNYLMELRFWDQIDSLRRNEPMDNNIYMEDLIHVEESTLEEIFRLILRIQKDLRLEFTGSLR